MLVRALLVVLTILNLGVAVWWAMQPPTPPAVPMPAVPAGVATLQLVNEAPAPAAAPTPPAAAPVAAPADAQADTAVAADAADSTPTPASTPAAPTTVAPETAPTPPAVAAPAPAPTQTQTDPAAKPAADAAVCLSVGPYADRDAAQAAVAALATGGARPRLREDADSGVTSFRVVLPTIGGEDGLRQATERIVAAGIRDYYPLRQGEAGNAIALGQYRSREGAERRRQELARAGFNADLIPSGGNGQSRWWLDLRADSAAQAAALRRQLGAARQRSVDCATLR